MSLFAASAVLLLSIISPSKTWYAPNQPVDIKVQETAPAKLVMIDFTGKVLEPAIDAAVTADKTLDIKAVFPQVAQPGNYVLFSVPDGKNITEFTGTPLVIQARTSPKFGGNVQTNVIKVQPLVYAKIDTEKGPMKAVFWYDVAPNTAASFISLSEGGFFDGLTFHRIVPGFVIQGGDPTGTGFGGPGYTVPAEFNDRLHDVGVLSMARTGDPLEGSGIQPRSDFANSAGSQFFICLSREKTQGLDRKYTGFGQIVEGLDTVTALADVPLADQERGRPEKPPVINKIQIVPVTAADNPYTELLKLRQIVEAKD